MSVSILSERYLEPCKDGGTLPCLNAQLPPESFYLLAEQGASINSPISFLIIVVVVSRFLEIVAGGILIWHGAKNGVALVWGWLLVTSSILMFDYHAALPYGHPLNTLFNISGLLSQAFFSIALLTFPDGKFKPRYLVWICLLLSCVYLFSRLAIPDITTPGHIWYPAGVAASFLANGLKIFIIYYRYLRVLTPSQRIQIRWIIYGYVIAFALHIGFGALYGWNPTLNIKYDPTYLIGLQIITALSFFVFNTTFVIAIVRYQLFDIDLIINRTIVYTLLTVFIAGIYVGIVSLFGTLFQGETNSAGVSLLATGIVATSFQGLRDGLQRGVNRLMFGQRDEPLRVLQQLGQQLKSAVTPQELLENAAQTIATTIKVPFVAIHIQYAQANILQAAAGISRTPTLDFPLVYQNERVGVLVIGQRSPNEALSLADQAILENIAQQMSAVVHNVRLLAELQHSRERLVTAREEERRRLRRDLHDGLGPALASQTLKIDAALDLLNIDPAEVAQLLTDVKTQSQTLVADVRRLVYELRPPALDEIGLAAALSGAIMQMRTAEKGLYFLIDSPDSLPELPAAVEVAAYRITMEAVTNVVKHAAARQCRIKIGLHNQPAELRLTIEDDGKGFSAPMTSGIGLHSMRERAEELGGKFSLHHLAAGGTQVMVTLPIQREPLP
jgi:signal transduction histidine kinase